MAAAPVILYWHRNDLRLGDNPALQHAAEQGQVQPVFIYDDTNRDWGYGGASQWWLHHSLVALQAAYKKQGITLILRKGRAETLIPQLAQDLSASEIVWNRRYEPHAIAQDTAIKNSLTTAGHAAHSFQRPFTDRAVAYPHQSQNAVQSLHAVLADIGGVRHADCAGYTEAGHIKARQARG